MIAADIEQRQFIKINGSRIGYITAGDPAAPPLVMVHGWISHAGIWRQTLNAFQHSHYCIAIDLLGHGFSDKPPRGDYSIPAQAWRVLELADALGLDQFSYLGHSMGGKIGLYIASIFAPERISRLVSVSGVVTDKLSAYVRYMLSPMYAAGSVLPSIWEFSRFALRYPWYSSIFNYALFYQPNAMPYGSIDLEMATIPGIEVPAWRDLQAIAALDLTDSLRYIRVPTLAIFGVHDRTVPVHHGRLVAEHVPGARLALLDECGHAPMVEQPRAYLKALREFLC